MTRPSLLLAFAVASVPAACGGEAAKSGPASSSVAASARPPAASARPATSGAPGAGDKSGKDLPNAMAIEPGKAAAATLDCKQAAFFGPFTFPDGGKHRLVVQAEVQAESDAQVCLGGDWQSKTGEFVAVAGVDCTEGGKPAKADVAIEYDPASGGVAANPVYLRLAFSDATCARSKVSLRLP